MPMIACRIEPNCYRDSVMLMRLSQELIALDGVLDAVLLMGTEANKGALHSFALSSPEAQVAGPSDLIISIKGDDRSSLEKAMAQAFEALGGGHTQDVAQLERDVYRTLELARAAHAEANLALISVPGPYASAEARRAICRGLHVFLFSDNVPIESEIELKASAAESDLLLMGPDCGTAIINGVPLGFANAIRPGPVGIVGASGTGIQEIMCLLDRAGLGVSQVIGTGGRDLTEEVNAATTIQGLDILETDPATETIVVVSKPAAPAVAERLLSRLSKCPKPVVVNFLGYTVPQRRRGNVAFVTFLEDVPPVVVNSLGGKWNPSGLAFWWDRPRAQAIFDEQVARLSKRQHLVRGLFSGGTLCEEAKLVMSSSLGEISAELLLGGGEGLTLAPGTHTAVDLGDDVFTHGRPHPMIDLSLRRALILEAARDLETAVVLFDVVLGYGAHADPAAVLGEAVTEARAMVAEMGQSLSFVASVCGVEADPQGLSRSEEALGRAGVAILPTNAQAARMACAIASRSLDAGLACAEPTIDLGNESFSSSSVLGGRISVINVGLRQFYEDLLSAGASAAHVDWQPPLGGDPRLADRLSRIL